MHGLISQMAAKLYLLIIVRGRPGQKNLARLTEAGHVVYMAFCVLICNETLRQPDDFRDSCKGLQALLNLVFAQSRVAVLV